MPDRTPLLRPYSLVARLHAIILAMLLTALSLLPKDSSAAQDASPALTPERELRTLKMDLREKLLAAMLPEKRKQAEDLLVLEKKLAGVQNFAGAIRARDERLKLEKEVAQIEKELPALRAQAQSLQARNLPERIELKVNDAAIMGLARNTKDGILSGWQTPGAAAAWKLPDLPPGGYEVLLRYSAEDGGIVVKEAFYSLAAKCGPAAKTAAERSLGTLRIRDGKGSITLLANPPEKSASLRVYSVTLVPASR